MARASRSKRSVKCSAETLTATSRLIDFAHAALADGNKDFVGAEIIARRYRHDVQGVYHNVAGDICAIFSQLNARTSPFPGNLPDHGVS